MRASPRQTDELGVVVPADIVAAEAAHRIDDHLNRRARFNPIASLKALTTQLAQEYEDRFLVELIQNAYDAHPATTRNGRVHVRLDESAQPPVLYVGNVGNPFTVENFDALTNVAQSSKPPGEGIGNKGVGFRSVLQVCDSPQVVSADPADPSSPGFGGFCFGFASDDDIRHRVASDTEYDTVQRDFSRYLLPVPAAPTDAAPYAMRADGMVTVVRLPLATSKAADLARAQVHRLLDPELPVALFLERLASITIDHVTTDGQVSRSQIDRTVADIPTGDDRAPLLRWVDTAGSRYLTTTRRLAAAEVRTVVARAVEAGELDESWHDWSSDVEVTLALSPYASGFTDGKLYTYLPMRMASPVRAHLHAPFHTKMARLDLNAASMFNSYLFSTAAQLAADTIALLTGGRVDLDTEARQAAVVDLLCWDIPYVPHVRRALAAAGCELATGAVLPTRTPDGPSWARIADTRAWDDPDGTVLNREALSRLTPLLAPNLGAARARRLAELVRSALGSHLEPTDDEIAVWAEQIASTKEGAPLSKWNAFLDDLARVFATRSAKALQGRMILLDDKRRLRRAGPWRAGHGSAAHPTVFVPPLTGGDSPDDVELSEVPKYLQRAVSFLHKDIKIRTRNAGRWERTPVGELLRKAELVEQFELTAVLGHLERLLASDVSDRTYSQALRWVFLQESASRSRVADLHRLGLRVPTDEGWVPASTAVFSPGWGTPRAATLAALLSQAGEHSTTLAALRACTTRRPADWPFKVHDLDAFRDFLSRCGVRDGLFPVPVRSATAIRMNGQHFTARAVAGRFSLPLDPVWDEHVDESKPAWLEGPQTPYTGDQELWVVPGQDAHASLSPAAKDKFAAALLDAAPHWPAETLQYRWRRRSPHHASRPNPQMWPSPARTFLERGAWFPMANPRSRDEHYFVPPGEGWTFDETGTDVAPRYARLAPIDHRRRLSASPQLAKKLSAVGLQTWNTPASAAGRLAELARLVASGDVAAGDALSVRRAVANAWADAVRHGTVLPAGVPVVVARRGVLDTAALSGSGPTVYAVDEPPGLVAHVLEAIGEPVVVADPGDGAAVKALLAAHGPGRVRRTSQVSAEVVLDGQPVLPGPDCGTPLLEVFGGWLARTLLAVLDVRSTRFTRITDRVLRDADARLRAARVAVGSRIELAVDNLPLPVTGHLAQAVHLDDPDHPLLVVRNGELPVPSWRAVDVLADEIAALIGQAATASEFRAVALALERSGAAWREPTAAELAAVLRCAEDDIRALYRDLSSSSEFLRHLLAPFVAVLASVDAADAFQDAEIADTDEIRAALAAAVGEQQAVALLDAASRADSFDAIRRRTSTALASLNDALIALGRAPLHFPEEHKAALDAYAAEHRSDLLDSLRLRHADAYRQRRPLDAYAAARSLQTLTADPAWLHAHEVPTDNLLHARATAWLDAAGPAQPGYFAPVDEARDANRVLLDTAVPHLSRLVHAWSARHGRPPASHWTDLTRLRDALDQSGCLDFESLDTAGVIDWLAALQLWPADMPKTANLTALGLTDQDLDRGTTAREAADMQRRKARTSVPFGDRVYDTSTAELQEFARAVDASVTDAQLATRPTLAPLAPAPARSTRSGAGGTPAWRHRTPEPSDEQTTAIGLAGELIAYRWLQKAYPGQVTPESWVSGNRSIALGGPPGNDRLGYDFKVSRRSGTLLFEVKATTTDGYAFDISDLELAAASAARKGQYRILFIRSVLTPQARELLVLPNPLEPESAALYTQTNRGMRLRFLPAPNAT